MEGPSPSTHRFQELQVPGPTGSKLELQALGPEARSQKYQTKNHPVVV